jgi:hypothetical protein
MSQTSQETITLPKKGMCFAFFKPFVLFILVAFTSFFQLRAQEKTTPTGKFGGVINATNNGVNTHCYVCGRVDRGARLCFVGTIC